MLGELLVKTFAVLLTALVFLVVVTSVRTLFLLLFVYPVSKYGKDQKAIDGIHSVFVSSLARPKIYFLVGLAIIFTVLIVQDIQHNLTALSTVGVFLVSLLSSFYIVNMDWKNAFKKKKQRGGKGKPPENKNR